LSSSSVQTTGSDAIVIAYSAIWLVLHSWLQCSGTKYRLDSGPSRYPARARVWLRQTMYSCSHGTGLRVAHTWLYCVPSTTGPFTICTILSHLYCYYSSLLKVVEKLGSSCNVLKDDDTESYYRMCTTTLVAFRKQGIFDSKNGTFGDPIQVLSVNDIIGKVTEVVYEH